MIRGHYHDIDPNSGKTFCLGPDVWGPITVMYGITHLKIGGGWCDHGGMDPDYGYCCYAIESLCSKQVEPLCAAERDQDPSSSVRGSEETGLSTPLSGTQGPSEYMDGGELEALVMLDAGI
jgi:hypothetical protein